MLCLRVSGRWKIGLIPKFDKLIATIRSREISASIILQSQSQLKTIYKDAAETIIGNCDTMLFLGGKESSTLKEISETLGKETIDLYNTSDTRGQSPSFGTTYQKTGKELMSRDELSVMDGSKCILQLRGVRPFLSDKFDITKHKRYKELSDFDKKNAFDEYISRLCSYPLLILDDFGMERGTEYGLEQVYSVIDSRYRSGKPLIVTTNLTLEELQHPQDTPHARIYDRLLSMCAPVRFTGSNFRKETAQDKLGRLKQLMKH